MAGINTLDSTRNSRVEKGLNPIPPDTLLFKAPNQVRQTQASWGIILCLALTIGLSNYGYGANELADFKKFRKFELFYEPSGVQQLPDGRFILIEDETSHSLDVFNLNIDGSISEQPLYRDALSNSIPDNSIVGRLADLEGVAVGEQGMIYAITSHARTKQGKRTDQREKLLRFRLDGLRISDFESAPHNLRNLIIKRHPHLDSHELNIEGLSFDRHKKKLLIGLRSPLQDSNASIVILGNPKALFKKDEKPHISTQAIQLNLEGGGIRAFSYDPYLGGYLMVSRQPKKAFKLWLWDGIPENKPRKIKVPSLKNLRNTEGVTPVRLDNGLKGILLVSDDGNGLRNKPGRYVFLKYEQLVISN